MVGMAQLRETVNVYFIAQWRKTKTHSQGYYIL